MKDGVFTPHLQFASMSIVGVVKKWLAPQTSPSLQYASHVLYKQVSPIMLRIAVVTVKDLPLSMKVYCL